MSGLDDFLENLRNSPFGRALSERELEQKAEQYRVFIKPLFDKLESIEENTKRDIFSNLPGFELFKISATAPPNTTLLPVTRKYIIYLGIFQGAFFSSDAFFDVSESGFSGIGTPTISFGSAGGENHPLYPGKVIPTNLSGGNKSDIFFNCAIGIPFNPGDSFWHYLAFCDDPNAFNQSLPNFFSIDATGRAYLRRAALDQTNGDQYVLFRATPTVNVSSPLNIRVQDGNGASVADVLDLSNDNVATSVLTLATLAGLYLFDGTNWDRARGDTTNGLDVDVTRVSGTVTIAGTVTDNAAAAASGGYSSNFQSALSTTVQSVKASAGKLGGWYIYNPNASVAYVQIFNVASGSVTLGTTTPTLSLGIPASSAANLMNGEGIDFSTAISIAATTTATGSTAPGSGLTTNFLYK